MIIIVIIMIMIILIIMIIIIMMIMIMIITRVKTWNVFLKSNTFYSTCSHVLSV